MSFDGQYPEQDVTASLQESFNEAFKLQDDLKEVKDCLSRVTPSIDFKPYELYNHFVRKAQKLAANVHTQVTQNLAQNVVVIVQDPDCSVKQKVEEVASFLHKIEGNDFTLDTDSSTIAFSTAIQSVSIVLNDVMGSAVGEAERYDSELTKLSAELADLKKKRNESAGMHVDEFYFVRAAEMIAIARRPELEASSEPNDEVEKDEIKEDEIKRIIEEGEKRLLEGSQVPLDPVVSMILQNKQALSEDDIRSVIEEGSNRRLTERIRSLPADAKEPLLNLLSKEPAPNLLSTFASVLAAYQNEKINGFSVRIKESKDRIRIVEQDKEKAERNTEEMASARDSLGEFDKRFKVVAEKLNKLQEVANAAEGYVQEYDHYLQEYNQFLKRFEDQTNTLKLRSERLSNADSALTSFTSHNIE
ncbi:hypothetical protein V5O48_009052 [Marasmius crinis-equi]|uniref:Uncharacterized protein n=1 Tax=Marasmius crinis-equi TaxID=585013 RepID=A0ABR3FCU0_9AGAR